MAQSIKNAAIYMVDPNVKYTVNAPKLLIELQVSPHLDKKHGKALTILTALLEATAKRSCQIADPVLIGLFECMKFVHKLTPEEEAEILKQQTIKDFEDI